MNLVTLIIQFKEQCKIYCTYFCNTIFKFFYSMDFFKKYCNYCINIYSFFFLTICLSDTNSKSKSSLSKFKQVGSSLINLIFSYRNVIQYQH